MTTTYLADICIPTLNEKGYIESTLANLMEQTLYKKGKIHIIIGDYKDQINADDDYLMNLCKKFKHVTYMPIFQKGISVARNTMISNSLSDVIVNFDSDGQFNRVDAVEKMIQPILAHGDVVMTNCETILFDFKTGKKADNPLNLYEIASRIGGAAEKYIVARGPGLTIDKTAFWSVGGFRDVPVGEDYFLGWDICYKYSMRAKQYIDDVKVFSSNRRAIGMEKHGLNSFDYTRNNYR